MNAPKPGPLDPLSVKCPWNLCRAAVGHRCVSVQWFEATEWAQNNPHPSRIAAAQKAGEGDPSSPARDEKGEEK